MTYNEPDAAVYKEPDALDMAKELVTQPDGSGAAETYALIAIAVELRRLNENIEKMMSPDGGSLDVRTEQGRVL